MEQIPPRRDPRRRLAGDALSCPGRGDQSLRLRALHATAAEIAGWRLHVGRLARRPHPPYGRLPVTQGPRPRRHRQHVDARNARMRSGRGFGSTSLVAAPIFIVHGGRSAAGPSFCCCAMSAPAPNWRSRSTQNHVLFQEIHHRVKNNLQQVAALIRLQQAPAAMKEDLTRRIDAMSAVHQHIYESNQYGVLDADAYLARVLTGLRDSGPAQALRSTGASRRSSSRRMKRSRLASSSMKSSPTPSSTPFPMVAPGASRSRWSARSRAAKRSSQLPTMARACLKRPRAGRAWAPASSPPWSASSTGSRR